MRCLQCGKEIPEGRKFCSSSCSAKYNNVRRQRRPWTEEQRVRVSEKRLKVLGSVPYSERVYECVCCGKQINSTQSRKFCNSCKKYISVLPTLQKLGVWTKGENVPNSLRKGQLLLYRKYFEEKESLLSLASKYRINKDTVKNYITFGGRVLLRTRSEAGKISVEEGRFSRRVSPSFKSGTHTSWEGKKFHFRSSWEEEYMKQLDEQKISYLYEPFSIRYFDTQRNEERVAIPDFFFPETNEIVELKSSYTYDEQNMKDKIQSYKAKGYKVKLLLNWVEMPL